MRLSALLKVSPPSVSRHPGKWIGGFLFLLLLGCPAAPTPAPPTTVAVPVPAVVPPAVIPSATPAPATIPSATPAPAVIPSATPAPAVIPDLSPPVAGKPLRNCEAVRAAYKELLTTPAHLRCSADTDCQVVSGECAMGLGGCYHAVNHTITQAAVSALGARFQELGCSGPVCRCARPPAARCEQSRCTAP